MKLSEDRRILIGGGAGLALLIFVLAWFFLLHPKMSHTAELQRQTDDARTANAQLTANIATLKKAQANLSTYTDQLRHVRDELPITDSLADFTDTTQHHAREHHLRITSMTVGTLAVVDATGTTTQEAATNGSASAAGKLFAIPVTLVTTGSFDRQSAFMKSLQKTGPRAALVTGARLSPGDDTKDGSIDKHCAMTTTFTLFAAPQNAEQAAELKKQLAG